MGFVQRLRTLMTERVPFENLVQDDDKVSVKDLLRFMEKSQETNTMLIKAVLDASVSQSKTLETYIDLFKPRTMPSTTLEERIQMKEAKIRESEWEGIENVQDFNEFTAGISRSTDD